MLHQQRFRSQTFSRRKFDTVTREFGVIKAVPNTDIYANVDENFLQDVSRDLQEKTVEKDNVPE